MLIRQIGISLLFLSMTGMTCPRKTDIHSRAPFLWENANVYFLLTDRFANGDPANDAQIGRPATAAKLRGFMGGDIRGIIQKLDDGYFDRLGISAIWFTPVFEQNRGIVNEGTGSTYGFHGYWTQDWTRLDPNFGTERDLAELVDKAHRRGIRILLDAVINHTGPVTAQDPLWSGWARTEPQCTYQGYASSITCTLVKNLPDIKTESNDPVELPPFLLKKWKREDRLKHELAELDAFFERTGYPRAPRFFIIKWLTDWVRHLGIDGYRCDTVKHVEESVWAELQREAARALADWKKNNPAKALDNNEFYMVGEVYGYNIAHGRDYDFGDRKVDYFANGFHSIINFGLKSDAQNASYEALFSKYANQIQGPLLGKGVLNYLSSHDDGSPFDKQRAKPFEAAVKLLLCPGAAQIYYGDETNRPLDIPGTEGDATLRSFMNWDDLQANADHNGHRTQDVLAHWQKLGRFRKNHPAVGAGEHRMLSEKPYVFQRTYTRRGFADTVVVALNLPKGKKNVSVKGVFPDGAALRDAYSGKAVWVKGGATVVDSNFDIVLLEKALPKRQ
ncbi:MAG: alpha-amylase family glycosyl hydrolase [Saprospiraceae bacterium]